MTTKQQAEILRAIAERAGMGLYHDGLNEILLLAGVITGMLFGAHFPAAGKVLIDNSNHERREVTVDEAIADLIKNVTIALPEDAATEFVALIERG